MDDLNALLNSIPTSNCPDREEAKRDIQSAISMNSETVIENINRCWVDIDQEVIDTLSQQDRQYRLFIKEFQEKYHDNR